MRIRTLDDVIHCDRTDTKRTDAGCLHCEFSAKLGMLWLCLWGQFEEVGE